MAFLAFLRFVSLSAGNIEAWQRALKAFEKNIGWHPSLLHALYPPHAPSPTRNSLLHAPPPTRYHPRHPIPMESTLSRSCRYMLQGKSRYLHLELVGIRDRLLRERCRTRIRIHSNLDPLESGSTRTQIPLESRSTQPGSRSVHRG